MSHTHSVTATLVCSTRLPIFMALQADSPSVIFRTIRLLKWQTLNKAMMRIFVINRAQCWDHITKVQRGKPLLIDLMFQNQLCVKFFINIQNLCLYWPPTAWLPKNQETCELISRQGSVWILTFSCRSPSADTPLKANNVTWFLLFRYDFADSWFWNIKSSWSGFHRCTVLIWSKHWARLTTKIRDLVLFKDGLSDDCCDWLVKNRRTGSRRS